MELGVVHVAQLFAALTLILLAAHATAALFARLRQPPVIGEVTAGLLLGPTLLGLVAAPVAAVLLPSAGPVSAVLAGLAEIGLLLLMFVAGGELRAQVTAVNRRTVGAVATTALIIPFVAGILVALALDDRNFSGPSGTPLTFALVFSIAVAVTSIPVISRIMLDLGIIHTAFARIVLSVAVLEDIVLYGVLAIVLSLASGSASESYGLWALVGVESVGWSTAYHMAATLALLAVFLAWGGRAVRWVLHSRFNAVERRSPIASRLVVLLSASMICVALGVNPIFGALLAGAAVRKSDPQLGAEPALPPEERPSSQPLPERTRPQSTQQAWEAIRQFSLATFIPIYFVTVGLKLDLARNFDPGFFVWFLLLCCAVKAISVWVSARMAGEHHRRALDLAVALNARGGPGIVLATVTLQAGVINDVFFTSIVLLSLLTSQFAGFWLDHRAAALLAADSPEDRGQAGGDDDERRRDAASTEPRIPSR